MLRGEEGNQARELDELIAWLKSQPRPDVISLSNALLIGLARRLKQDLGCPVVCHLQGEDYFLDGLPEAQRDPAWQTVRERAADVDLFIAPSRYFGEEMRRRLGLPANRMTVVHYGIHVDGFESAPAPVDPPVLGYFARMCRDKGLDLLVDAYLCLRKRNRVKRLKLRVGGGCGPADQALVNALRAKIRAHWVGRDAAFVPNPDRAGKQAFLRSLSVLSVPARYGERFGLYLLEAWAAGVPVVQPRVAAFPELIEATGGGRLYEPSSPEALALALEELLLDPARARAMGAAGREAVLSGFRADTMAAKILEAYRALTPAPRSTTRA
jgi:glycosyltransferase involved in cell wall biosynthesis